MPAPNDCLVHLPVANQQRDELRHASLAGHVRGEKSGTAGNGSKKRGRGRRQAAEPPSKVNVASLLQRAVDVKAGQMDVGPQLASDGDPKSSTPGAETQQPSEEATGVTCKQGEALPSVPTPSTAAPESPTSEEDKSLPSVGGLFQGCGSGTDPCSQQPSTLPSAGGSVADVPMVKETEEDPRRSRKLCLRRETPLLAPTSRPEACKSESASRCQAS